jgi:outer membrane protein assembly factor BamE (lipoprotein component of BamABCDE complex)
MDTGKKRHDPKRCAMRLLSMVLLAGLLSGCGLFKSEQAKFLCTAKDHATQADVKHRLGEPMATTPGPEGQTVWIYQLRTPQAGSRINAAGTWCEEYVLTFDREHVLRSWTQKKQFHGGETQPQFCVPNGYAS